jgi:predicted HicB family RNase H-like nuclease
MIPLTLPDNEMFEIMKMAHERDMTLNAFIEEVLEDYVTKHEHMIK